MAERTIHTCGRCGARWSHKCGRVRRILRELQQMVKWMLGGHKL